MTMYNNTVKQMKTKFIVSCVITVILLIPTMIVSGSQVGIGGVLIYALVGIIVLPVEILGMILNIVPLLKGFFIPIPVISYIIESFKSLVMGFKATVWLFRNWKNAE